MTEPDILKQVDKAIAQHKAALKAGKGKDKAKRELRNYLSRIAKNYDDWMVKNE